MDNPEFNEMETIDLRLYLKMLQKWKWLIVGMTLLAVLTSGILSFFVLAPVYQSKAVIMVKQYQDPKTGQRQERQDDLESVVNSLSRLPEMTIKTYVGQLKNEALLRNVIDSLKLDKAVYSPNALSGLIEVSVVPETNLIELAVKNNDPKLAAKIANTLAEKFLEFVGSANQKQLVVSAEFLTKQLVEKNKEVTEAVNNLNKYRNQARNVAYIQQEVQNKNLNLTNYQNLLLQAETDYQQALAGKAAAEQKLQTTPKKMELEENNPAYAALTQLVDNKSVQLAEMEARKRSIQGSVEQIQKDLENLQAELNSKREVDTQLQEKMEQIKQTRNILAEKLTQVQIIKSINLSQTSLQIVTPAFPQDNPVSPQKLLNMAIALVLGVMVSVGCAFALEFLNNTINKPEDVEQHLGLPILGNIPFARKEDFE